MSDMIDTEANDELIDAIRSLDERLRRVERSVHELREAMDSNDLLDVDENEFD